MLNIFADALLIATRLGSLPEGSRHVHRRTPREFQDVEGLHNAQILKFQGR